MTADQTAQGDEALNPNETDGELPRSWPGGMAGSAAAASPVAELCARCGVDLTRFNRAIWRPFNLCLGCDGELSRAP